MSRLPLATAAALAMAILGLFAVAQAHACSPVPGYRPPTNVELVDEADLVVLARVVGGATSVGDDPGITSLPPVTLQPIRVLKGRAPARLSVDGLLAGRNGGAMPVTPTALDTVHPSALWGACVRQAYARGALVVALFRRDKGRYVPLWHPLARSIEDVASPSSLWVRAAALYVGLLYAHRGADRRAAFTAERRRLVRGSADDRAIAADIARYLAIASASRKLGAGSTGSS